MQGRSGWWPAEELGPEHLDLHPHGSTEAGTAEQAKSLEGAWGSECKVEVQDHNFSEGGDLLPQYAHRQSTQ